jgi:hypothetical protein
LKLETLKLETQIKSSEKLLFISSPDRADILLKPLRAKEIKAKAGQVVFKNGV